MVMALVVLSSPRSVCERLDETDKRSVLPMQNWAGMRLSRFVLASFSMGEADGGRTCADLILVYFERCVEPISMRSFQDERGSKMKNSTHNRCFPISTF
jgi:hypothetical protein